MATILLVEEERIVRHLLRSILEEAGHGVIEACDGADALAQYQSHQTDLILTDLMMPRKEGLTFIAEVQRQFPHAKIAAMTSGGVEPWPLSTKRACWGSPLYCESRWIWRSCATS